MVVAAKSSCSEKGKRQGLFDAEHCQEQDSATTSTLIQEGTKFEMEFSCESGVCESNWKPCRHTA